MLTLLSTFTASALFLPMIAQAAPGWECSSPKWTGSMALVDRIFAPTLESECKLATQDAPDFRKIREALEVEARRDSTSFEKPVDESIDGLPGTRMNIESRLTSESNGKLDYTRIVKIATDEKSRLIYSSQSIQTKGTGNLALLRRIDDRISITYDPKSGVLAAQISRVRGIRKPGLGAFAKLGGGKSFEERVMADVLKDFDPHARMRTIAQSL